MDHSLYKLPVEVSICISLQVKAFTDMGAATLRDSDILLLERTPYHLEETTKCLQGVTPIGASRISPRSLSGCCQTAGSWTPSSCEQDPALPYLHASRSGPCAWFTWLPRRFIRRSNTATETAVSRSLLKTVRTMARH